MTDAARVCATCEWWWSPSEGDEPYGTCRLGSHLTSDVIPKAMAVEPVRSWWHPATLRTTADYGCVQWTATEEENDAA